MNIREIRSSTGMTQKAFAEYFNIPVRTLQDWEGERRTPPTYVVELIKYKVEKEVEGMLRYDEMKKDYGSIEYEGKQYALTQEAYVDTGQTYIASAIDREGNEYLVTWEITDEAVEAKEENNVAFLQDESNMCDWDNPISVTEV